MSKPVLGVIGGSGFYQMKALTAVEQVELTTPFGRPSDPFFRGKLGDCDVVFLSRHGRGHRLMPSELNFRANIYGMKQLGVDHLVSVSTAGSMKEELRPATWWCPTSSSTTPPSGRRPFSATGSSLTSRSPTRYARPWRASFPSP